MNNKITHLRIVDASLRLRPPRCIRASVIGVDADEIELFGIFELYIIRRAAEFAAEYKVKQLL